mmetsp:Transcript_19283/g.40818  ORF Transcript_19283/g.40818 Transcript_19283/m.40818 type:complete len:205 (+) Transcript_19283:42-656(+)
MTSYENIMNGLSTPESKAALAAARERADALRQSLLEAETALRATQEIEVLGSAGSSSARVSDASATEQLAAERLRSESLETQLLEAQLALDEEQAKRKALELLLEHLQEENMSLHRKWARSRDTASRGQLSSQESSESVRPPTPKPSAPSPPPPPRWSYASPSAGRVQASRRSRSVTHSLGLQGALTEATPRYVGLQCARFPHF